jgi:hypothetical protein
MSQALDAWLDQDHPAGDEPGGSRLAMWGVIAGLLLPIVGLVIAIVLLVRGQVGPGLGVTLASFVGMIAAVALLA